MAFVVKQGDAYAVPLAAELNGKGLNLAEVEFIEFTLTGGLRKTCAVRTAGEELIVTGDISYDAAKRLLYVPLSQQETFALAPNSVCAADLRVKFRGGNVLGARRMLRILAADALSEEVL